MAKANLGVTTDPPLRQVARALKDADPEARKRLGKEHKRLAKVITDDSKTKASGLGGVHSKAASAIRPSASATELKITVNASGSHPEALVAFFGAKARTGWYARARYAASTPQHPAWIGADWDPGDNDGPYAIGDSIREHLDDVIEGELDVLEAIWDAAFPPA